MSDTEQVKSSRFLAVSHHSEFFPPRVVVEPLPAGPDFPVRDFRVDDGGIPLGKILAQMGSLREGDSALSVMVRLKLLGAHETFGPAEVLITMDLTEGRVTLVFDDDTWVRFRSPAHENLTGHGMEEPILREGVTFEGASGRHYVVGSEIGRGGTAIVHISRSAGGDYAAKCVMPGRFNTRDLVPRFAREIQNLHAVSSRYVVPFVDSAYSDKLSILVMEYASSSIYRELYTVGKPEFERAIRWIGQTLEGLAAIHEIGMVHRDVTPKNLLLRDDSILIGDFGTVRRLPDLDITSGLKDPEVGSLQYISAEQRRDPHHCEPADDVFSLGQVAYHLLTGIPPVGNPPPLSAFPEISSAVADVVAVMRAFKRDERPTSAIEARSLWLRAVS
jgi:serine/threonine protein kinase